MSTATDARVEVLSALEVTRAHAGALELDLGTLLAEDVTFDVRAVAAATGTTFDGASRVRGRDVLQRVIAELFALPSESDGNGRFAQLPEPTTGFPRARALPPSETPRTKWEAFAKEKGIKKRKRSKETFDEQSEEWKRRYGYKRVNDANDVIIAPAKMTDVVGKTEDPFTREEREKRERTQKNREKQDKNLMRAVQEKGVKALPPTLRLAVTGQKDSVGSGKLGKREMVHVASRVAQSTASMGKFNAPVAGDEKIKLKKGARRQFDDNLDTEKTRKKSQEIVEKLLLKEKAGGMVDVNMAARKIQQEKEKANRKNKSSGKSTEKKIGGKTGGKTGGKVGSKSKK